MVLLRPLRLNSFDLQKTRKPLRFQAILIGGSKRVQLAIKLHQKRCRCEKPRSFNDFRVFLRPIFEVGKKISKRVLAKSMDLNLYARDFEPLFRSFFGKAARFCSRQNVEFEQAFLLVLLDRHSECMCHCVDTGKAQNTLQCLGGTL